MLTVYGIETDIVANGGSRDNVATVLTVYGIETFHHQIRQIRQA